ncbi:MAG: hypothetical protein KKI15_20415 [Proteobacteria bacterium]|nr:hypothetical protein [Pseudomonadota bacterium]
MSAILTLADFSYRLVSHHKSSHIGTYQGRILRDEKFNETALALAEEKWKRQSTLGQIIEVVCLSDGIGKDILIEPGKKQYRSISH